MRNLGVQDVLILLDGLDETKEFELQPTGHGEFDYAPIVRFSSHAFLKSNLLTQLHLIAFLPIPMSAFDIKLLKLAARFDKGGCIDLQVLLPA